MFSDDNDRPAPHIVWGGGNNNASRKLSPAHGIISTQGKLCVITLGINCILHTTYSPWNTSITNEDVLEGTPWILLFIGPINKDSLEIKLFTKGCLGSSVG